jgi:nitroreductase
MNEMLMDVSGLRQGLLSMTFDEILKARYSCRKYDPSRPIDADQIRTLVEAGRIAPSASNTQTWRFIAVTGRERIEELWQKGMRNLISNKWMRDAPLVLVGCAKLDIITNRVGTGITGIEYYKIDMGIAMEHIVLKATELGLGTCWIGWFNEDGVREVLGIPQNVKVLTLLSVGYPLDAMTGDHKRKKLEKILYFDKWGASE